MAEYDPEFLQKFLEIPEIKIESNIHSMLDILFKEVNSNTFKYSYTMNQLEKFVKRLPVTQEMISFAKDNQHNIFIDIFFDYLQR